jgi:hypothetical protein
MMPYNRRSYYKISLIIGKNRAEYANKIFDIEENALLFATPKSLIITFHRTNSNQDTFVFLLLSL